MAEISEREAEVLSLASKGKTDEGIAQAMNITVATVRGYWLRIRSKLGGTSRAELVAQWLTAAHRSDERTSSDLHAANTLDNRDNFEKVLADERKAMDEIFKHATVEELDRVHELRTRSDAELKETYDGADRATSDTD